MIDRQSVVNRSADVDQAFDDLVCEVSAKLEAGEAIDLDAIAVEYPEHAERLRKLLPTLQAMAELGHSDTDLLAASPTSPAPTQLRTGVLGDYRILREIGRGGMGVVYEAEQVSLGRKVALKVLPFAAMLDQKQLQRFQNEARAAASLRHPNIVQVHFVGCERAVHFYAMDYIEGQTLGELITHLRRLEASGGEVPKDAGRPVPDLADTLTSGRFASPSACSAPNVPTAAHMHEETPGNTAETKRTPHAAISTERSTKSPAYFRSIAQIGVQVAEALDHAHQHGVVHRDVKPANVILDNSGKPWVTDFGLARIETDATLTVTGDLLGTVRYMSPEQALAKRIVVDHRTDVYSLGATLYELLTLQPVFTGQDRQELLRQIAFEDPKPPRRLNKAIPAELEIIVLKAMAKNPAERYDTAQELADDLRRFLEDRPIRARRPTLVQLAAKWSRRHKPIVWSAAISTFLLLVVGLVGLGIGNLMITKERDEKDQALVAKDDALMAKNVALKDKDEALSSAVANLLNAEAERRRAESNLSLALDALDTVYLRAIGRDRLLGDRDREDARRELSNMEKTLIEEGLDFYAQIATQNEDSTVATSETARAFLQIAMLQANLDDGKAADVAFVEAIARLKNLTKSFPDNVDYFQQLGRAYYAKGNLSRWWPKADNTFAEAVDALSKAIDLSPSDASLFDLRAAAYERVSQYDKRLEDLLKAVQLQPDNAKHHYALAGLFRFAPDPTVLNRSLALEHAQKAVELAPENATYHATLARYLSEAGRRQEALAVFGRAVSLDSGLADVYNQRSMVYRDAGRLEEALKDAEKAIELAPENAQHYRRRAETLKTLGRFEESLADFSVVERMDPNQRYLYSERGGLYLSRGQYSLALQDYDKALQLAPQWWWVYKRKAKAHFHLSQYAAALADLKTALELDPKDTSTLGWISPALVATCPDQSFRDGLLELAAGAVDKSPDPAGALQDRIALHLGLGEWKKGQADLEKAIESETANHYLYYQNALLCLILNEAPKYRDACAKMVEKLGETDDPMAANFVAWTCALAPDSVDDYAPVLACATKAVEAQPHTDQFLNTLGAILYREGRQEEAIEWLTEIDQPLEGPDAKSISSPAYTWYFLAMVQKKAGNGEKAREYLNKANQVTDQVLADEENPPVWNRRATLELLRKEAEALVEGPDVEPESPDQEKPDPTGDAGPSLSGSYQWVVLCRRAQRFASQENWTEAASAFSEAVNLRPDDWKLWRSLGEAHEKLDQWDQAITEYQKAIELDPEQWPFWKTRAENFAPSEQWDKAMAFYTTLIEHNADNGSLRKGLGEAHEKLGQWDQAFAEYQKAIELEPEEWLSWKTLAASLAESGQNEKAIALYTSLIEHHSDNGELWQGRAAAYVQLKQWDQAIEDYSRVIKLQPNNVVALRQRRLAYVHLKEWNRAVEDQNEIVKLQPEAPAQALIRAQLLLLADRKEEYDKACAEMLDRFGESENPAGMFETARACSMGPSEACDPSVSVGLAKRAVAKAPKPWTHSFLGLAHLRAGEHEEAAENFYKSLSLGTNWHERQLNWFGLAMVYHASGETGKAMQLFDRAATWMEANPEKCQQVLQDWLDALLRRREAEQLLRVTEDDRTRLVEEYLARQVEAHPEDPQVWLDRAEWRQQKGLVAKAIEDYSQLIKLRPDDANVWRQRAELYKQLGAYDKVISDCTEAIRLDPALHTVHGLRAEAYLKSGDYEKAIQDCDEMIRLDPSGAWAYWIRGNAFLKANNPDQAIADCTEAIRLQPSSQAAYIRRAAAYLAKADYDQAIKDYRQAIKTKPKETWCWLMVLETEFARGASAEQVQAVVAEAEASLDEPEALEVAFHYAAWALWLDRRDEYEKICRDALARFGDSTKPRTLYLLARMAALTSQPVLETSRLVEMAGRAANADSNPWIQHSLGLCLLRDGQTDAAIEQFHQSLGQTWIAAPVNWLGLVLSHSAAGRDSDAQDWLKKAQEWVKQNPLNAVSELSPHDRIACQLLLREAEQRMEGKPSNKDGSKGDTR